MSKLCALVVAAILIGGASVAHTQERALQPLQVNVFPAGFLLPLWVAQDKGFFAQNGVVVNLINTPNSVEQMTGLIDGRFDIAMTAIDNVVAYMEGQGEALTVQKPDIVGVMGSSSGFLSLIVAPDVKSTSDLRGKVLSVDAMTTGYAFTLRKILQRSGLNDGDYTLVKVGGMKERYEALVDHKQAGSLLVPPFTLAATDRGFNEIGTALSVLGHYQAGVAAVRREWAVSHKDAVIGFIRSNIAALDWLYSSANENEALQILQKHLPGTTPDVAEKSYRVLLDPINGFPKKAEIDVDGVKSVIEIRSQYAEPHMSLTDATRYYDLSYYDAAITNH
jgi:ABC-type nitrate/sulfonate/bicarbonate transport system substrate-binding protein